MTRLRGTPRDPVRFSFDGETYTGERGDSLAEALWAAGVRSLSRSPKFHRPRGPWCLRGQCEGCLVRVDGVPNAMACNTPITADLRAESQNFVGTPSFDLLRMADWAFPHGMNHHELLAGVPVAEDIMKAMARRIAGLGTLPDAPRAARPAQDREVSVLIVGAGRAGKSVQDALNAQGVSDVLSIDAEHTAEIAIGVFGPRKQVIVVGPAGVTRITPRASIFATGSYDVLPLFEDNDLPGIVSLRAAERLAARGIAVGQHPLVLLAPGGTGAGRAFAEGQGYTFMQATPIAASGLDAITHVTVRDGEVTRKLETDALVIDGPRSAAYELAVQAGALAAPTPHGFSVQVDDDGRAAESVWAIGALTAREVDPTRLARAVRVSLR